MTVSVALRFVMLCLAVVGAVGLLIGRAFSGTAPVVVACLGDSNGVVNAPTWCDRAQQLDPDARWSNYSVGGGMACHGLDVEPSHPWSAVNGDVQLDRAIADGATVVIAAFGTNDLAMQAWTGNTIRDIVQCYRALYRTARRAGVAFWIALTPPVHPPLSEARPERNARIHQLNRRLRCGFRAARLIDFHHDFPAELFAADGLHVNGAGHALRARRAVTRILAER